MKPSRAFDSVFFNGAATPGLAVVEGNSGSPRKWQEMGGYGLTGATIRFTGLGLAKFDVIITLVTDEHWAEWEAYQFILEPPRPGVYARALSVFHPLLRQRKINECIIEDVALPKQTQAGVWQVLIPCRAFRKPKITLATPEGAKATPNDPNAAARALVEANSALIAAQREALARR